MREKKVCLSDIYMNPLVPSYYITNSLRSINYSVSVIHERRMDHFYKICDLPKVTQQVTCWVEKQIQPLP